MIINQRKELTMIGFCTTIGTTAAIELFTSGLMLGLSAYATAKQTMKTN